MLDSVSRISSVLLSEQQCEQHDRTFPECSPQATGARVVGFFPGLGSRDAYQDLDRSLLDCGIPEVADVYHEGARALGFPGQPEKLLMNPGNLPAERLERQGFIGAAFLVHNLALAAHLRGLADRTGTPLSFIAYTGESFGVIASAVASGSLSVADGVRIARAFTPLVLLAAEGGPPEGALARDLLAHLPEQVRGRRLVPEPCHVVGLRGDPDDLAGVLAEIGRSYPVTDVEVHKLYSPRQTNVYVRSGVRPGFEEFLRGHPAVTAEELKRPTTFLAHSARMRPVRRALERFIEANGITFRDPRTPVVANNRAGLLTTAAEVRDAVLAMTDEIMASRTTLATVAELHPDLVVELGLGGRSVRLLADNHLDTPATSHTGDPADADAVLHAVRLAHELAGTLAELDTPDARVTARHHDLLRDVFRLASANSFCAAHLYGTLGRAVTGEMLGDGAGTPALHEFLETFQHTRDHRDSVDLDGGELVVRARLRKHLTGPAHRLGQAYAELRVLDRKGEISSRSTTGTTRAEAVVVHLGRIVDPDRGQALDEPWARRLHDRFTRSDAGDPVDHPAHRPAVRHLIGQYTLFRLLQRCRPALFAQTDHYLAGSDPTGWLAALAASGAIDLPETVRRYDAYLAAGAGTEEAESHLDRLLSALGRSDVPVVSPAGVPMQARKDLAAATRAVFREGALDDPVRRIHLNGNCQILALGSAPGPGRFDAGPFRTDVVLVRSPEEVRQRHVNPALDEFEERCVLALTEENGRILRFARDRRLLSSTVCAYLHIDERVVGFGKGGSESMTIFVRKDGTDRIIVRKVLSEALTTARWNPDGQGVMLPPFAKARKQAEYLQALPGSVRRYFPEVHGIVERDVPVPHHLRGNGGGSHREVICEMEYVTGEEVSRFVERNSPPPAVIARLYEQIFRVLNENVHTVNRVPAPGETLEVSYFRKIEDRLDLCRRTAPNTFGPRLLDTERIIINGVPYLNTPALLRRFREHPEYLQVLEPRFHSLVMGDTNTENIKIGDTAPLHRAQRLIEAGAPRAEVDAALAAITPESLGIRFLDPRAIGFKGEGRDTRDDPMYDNKPWHNSIGHYDEIHYEQFTLRVRTGENTTPSVDVEFTPGNPYQRAYRVRDVAATGGRVGDTVLHKGMEDYFGPVMTAAYDLGNPRSPYTEDDPYWLVRFVFVMGTHFTAMPPYHFQSELDGTLTDTYQTQRRPVAIYCEGIKWLNWALEMLEGRRTEFLGVRVPPLPHLATAPTATGAAEAPGTEGTHSPHARRPGQARRRSCAAAHSPAGRSRRSSRSCATERPGGGSPRPASRHQPTGPDRPSRGQR